MSVRTSATPISPREETILIPGNTNSGSAAMGQCEPAYFGAPENATLFHFLVRDGLNLCDRHPLLPWMGKLDGLN